MAASKGYNRIAEQLISDGATVDFAEDALTPLVQAAINGHKNTCLLLLENRADVNLQVIGLQQDEMSNTALYYATRCDKSEIVDLLLYRGATLVVAENHFALTPISAAITYHCCRTLKVLLEYCENANMQLPLEFLLDMCFLQKKEECAIIILRHGYYPSLGKQSTDGILSYFRQAEMYNLIKLMCILVEINPQYLQEEWLVTQEYTLDLPKPYYFHFRSWLAEYRKHPPSLQKSCRSTILAQLGSCYTTKIRRLPLPTALKTFLTTLESAYEHNY